jgi:hypothetical protein
MRLLFYTIIGSLTILFMMAPSFGMTPEDNAKFEQVKQQWIEEVRQSRERASQEAEQEANQRKEEQERKEREYLVESVGEKIFFKTCHETIYYSQDLLSENPYDVGGKCYIINTFEVAHIQILNRSTALLMYQNQVVFADFGKLPAPPQGTMRAYVVKGDPKPFKYKSTSGSVVIAIKVHVLKELIEE